MSFDDFIEKMEDEEEEEEYSVEEIREAGEKVIEEMPKESEDAKTYMRAAIQLMIDSLRGEATWD